MDRQRPECSRRAWLKTLAAGTFVGAVSTGRTGAGESIVQNQRPWITVRGIYGGFLREMRQRDQTPAAYGITAVWVGSGSLTVEAVAEMRALGLQVFAEFNSMHAAQYLKEPEAASYVDTWECDKLLSRSTGAAP